MKKIKVGIVGYGNLGKSVEENIIKNEDFELVGIFTKRDITHVYSKFNSKVYSFSQINDFENIVDIMFMCGSSKNDILKQVPKVLQNFNVIDSFDMHDKIPKYADKIDLIAKNNGKIAIYSCGWDPGVFSLMRVLFSNVLSEEIFTFWGKGVSQGHSDAIRKIKGVQNAVQFTIPKKKFLKNISKGKKIEYNSKLTHKRQCFVYLEKGVDKFIIKQKIVNMPSYFEGYDTKVKFVSCKKVEKIQSNLFHSGIVTSEKNKMMFSLNLDSNPDFTAKVMIAYSHAISKLKKEEKAGAFSVLDIPFSYLCKDLKKSMGKFI